MLEEKAYDHGDATVGSAATTSDDVSNATKEVNANED